MYWVQCLSIESVNTSYFYHYYNYDNFDILFWSNQLLGFQIYLYLTFVAACLRDILLSLFENEDLSK